MVNDSIQRCSRCGRPRPSILDNRGLCFNGADCDWQKPITDSVVMALSIDGLQLGDDELRAIGASLIGLIRYHERRAATRQQSEGSKSNDSQG